MIQYKKVVVFFTICLLMSAFAFSFYTKDTFLFVSGTNVYAADDKNDDGDQENPCPECLECPDPAKVVLRGLEDKKIMVENQHKALVQEKKELEIFEEQIDEKLVNLKTLKKQIEDDLALLEKKKTQKEQQEEALYEAKIGRLVKMLAGMKPKSAAPIIDKMKLEVAQEIFLRMREASASEILSFVDSEKAAKISERLVFKRN